MKLVFNLYLMLSIVLFGFSCSSFKCPETEIFSQTNGGKCGEKITINEVIAKDGAKVILNVDSFEYSIFQINGEGFEPYESMSFISNSCHETLYTPIKADKSGKILPMGVLPAVIGETGGVCHINILREKNSIHLKFPWGTKTLNP